MIRLFLLGPTACTGPDGEELAGVLRSRKRLALLAYLAVAHPTGFHRRDTLVGLLWPESEQKRARAALRQAARHLRREVGDTLQSRGTEELGLDWNAFWCDAVACRHALEGGDVEQGLALYEQDLLSGFYLSKTPGFEEWLDGERRSLRRAAADAAWGLAEEASDGQEASRWARRAAVFTPYDEAATRRLMTFLDRRGEAIGALREFDRFQRRVREEFGSDPGPETRALAGRIKAGTRVGSPAPIAPGVTDPEDRVAASPVEVSATELRSARRRPSALPRPPAVSPSRQETTAAAVAKSPTRVMAFAGLTLILLGVFAGVRWVDRLDLRPQYEFTQLRPITSEEGLEVMPVLSPRGNRVAYVAGDPGYRDLYVRRVDVGNPTSLTEGFPGDHTRPSFSPNGDWVAFHTSLRDGTFAIHRVASSGGEVSSIYDVPEEMLLGGPSWSNDGRRIAFRVARSIMILDLATRDSIKFPVTEAVHSLAWSPGDDRIAFVSENTEYPLGTNRGPSSIWLLDVATGEQARLPSPDGMDQSPRWKDDRHLWFISDRDGATGIYAQEFDGTDPAGPSVLLRSVPSLRSFSLSENGQRVAYATLQVDWDIWSVRLPGGEDPVDLSRGTKLTRASQTIETLAVSPDGSRLAFDSDVGGQQDLFLMDATGGEARRLTEHPEDDFAPVFSPDGDALVYYSYRARGRDLYTVDLDGRLEQPVEANEVSEAFPHWGTTGLVYQAIVDSTDRTAVLLRPQNADGTWGAPVPLVDPPAHKARLSPDGRWMSYLTRDLSIRLLSMGTGETRAIQDSVRIAGIQVWSSDSESIYFAATRGSEPSWQTGIWQVPISGGEARLVAVEPDRKFGRFWFDVSGDRIFYTRLEYRDAGIWVGEITEPD